MPGALAPDTRPVHKDLLHCFPSPRSAAHPAGAVAGPSRPRLARLFGKRYEFRLPWGVTRRCTAGWNVAGAAIRHPKVLPGCRRVSGDQAELPGPRDGLGAVGGAELAQDVGHVLFDRVERHHQFVGDALV